MKTDSNAQSTPKGIPTIYDLELPGFVIRCDPFNEKDQKDYYLEDQTPDGTLGSYHLGNSKKIPLVRALANGHEVAARVKSGYKVDQHIHFHPSYSCLPSDHPLKVHGVPKRVHWKKSSQESLEPNKPSEKLRKNRPIDPEERYIGIDEIMAALEPPVPTPVAHDDTGEATLNVAENVAPEVAIEIVSDKAPETPPDEAAEIDAVLLAA